MHQKYVTIHDRVKIKCGLHFHFTYMQISLLKVKTHYEMVSKHDIFIKNAKIRLIVKEKGLYLVGVY